MPRSRLSAKLDDFVPSLTLRLKTTKLQRLAAGRPIFDFGLGETRGALPKHIAEGAIDAYRGGHTQYADPAGIEPLRQAILAWLDLEETHGPDQVVVATGAKQGLFNVFLALADPGDLFLFDCAPWVSYLPLAVAAGVTPERVSSSAGPAGRLKVAAGDLERSLARHSEARLFLLNSPCNPTAQVYDQDEIVALLEVCAQHEVYFVLDRLYWRLTFDGGYPAPLADRRTRRWLIQVDGLSKNFRRTGGIRIGWTVAPQDVAAAMVNLQSHYTSGPSVPAQHAALAALTAPYDPEMRDAIQRKAALMVREAPALAGVEVWPTVGAFYSFWDVRGTLGLRTPAGDPIESSHDLAAYLLESEGVLTLPGEAFQQPGFLRLSITLPDAELVGGVQAAAEALDRLH